MYWAKACDFKGDYIKYQITNKNMCGTACKSNSLCTHFVWTPYNGGTCYMKSGIVSKSDAVYIGDDLMICGYLSNIFK